MNWTLFTDIAQLHTFEEFAIRDGVHPKNAKLEPLKKAAMLVAHSNGTAQIQWIGHQAEIRSKVFRDITQSVRLTRFSLKNAVVIPAFQECHTHLLYAGHRREEFERRNRGESYLQIAESGGGIRSTIASTKAASAGRLKRDMLLRLQEFAEQGVTTVEVKTGYAASVEAELQHLRILLSLRSQAEKDLRMPRLIVTCLAAHSLPDGYTEDEWLNEVEKKLFPFLKAKKIRVDAFIDKSAFSLPRARLHFERAKALGLEISIHADQLSRTGATQFGVMIGAQSVDHVIEVNNQDLKTLAKSETVAVLLPAADLYSRLPYPRARAMIEAGARIALATDHNPGSSPGLDIALVGLLARTNMQMHLAEVLCAYTYNAARAMGLRKELGALTVGRRADFICLRPKTDLTDLFYEVGPKRSAASIMSVWRDGVQMMPIK
jgi:imidazolonepropionase